MICFKHGNNDQRGLEEWIKEAGVEMEGLVGRMIQTGVDGGLIRAGAREMERSGPGSVLLLFRCMIHAHMSDQPWRPSPRCDEKGPSGLGLQSSSDARIWTTPCR